MSAGGKTRAVDLDEDVVNYYQYSAARGDAAAQVSLPSSDLCHDPGDLIRMWRQVALGQLYYFGARGIEQDYAEALRWWVWHCKPRRF